MQRDTKVFELIQKERERQTRGIELIASENFTSPAGYGSRRFCFDQ